MGVTNPVFPAPDGSYEVSEQTLAAVTFYLQTLAMPARRAPESATTGETLFQLAGCAQCHTPTHQTGPSMVRSLANQTIYPFSDLLLHDMGPVLADNRPESRG
jgi:CxxC motif-containing protein (DUF1111 family)